MREEELRRYFLEEADVGDLVRDSKGSVVHVDDVSSIIRIANTKTTFLLERQHIIKLCDALVERTLTPDELNVIAFALLASDAFEWDDDVISDVLLD